jgi:hypothetical protein
MKTKLQVINYIRAGYPGLYLVSPEGTRVEAEIKQIAQELKYNLFFWSVVDGLVDTEKGTNNSANDPLEALIAIKEIKEQTIILLRDFHLFLQDPIAPCCLWIDEVEKGIQRHQKLQCNRRRHFKQGIWQLHFMDAGKGLRGICRRHSQ